MSGFQTALKEKGGIEFRDDFLSQLGPKMALFTLPTQARGMAASPLGGVLQGIQVPKMALVAEVKDRKEFERALDAVILAVNDELERQTAASAPEPEAEETRRPGEAKKKASPPQPPRFRKTSPSPPVFVLTLPPGLAALTNLNLTVALGKNYVVIASGADVARDVLALEGETERQWRPSGKLSETFSQFPTDLMFLRVNDPTNTLPETLANLPTAVQTLGDQMAAKIASDSEAPGPGGPGQPGGGGDPRSNPVGVAPPGTSGSSGYDSTSSGTGVPGMTSGSSGYPGMTSGSGGPPGIAPAPVGAPGMSGPGGNRPGGQAGKDKFSIQIDPSQIPSAAEVRPYLFPSATAVAVDDQGIRITSRGAFPNIISAQGGIAAALLMPAIQAARDAAQRAAAQGGLAGGNVPGAAANLGQGWQPDPALMAQLAPVSDLPRGLAIRVPQGFTALSAAPTSTLPGGFTIDSKAWKGPDGPGGAGSPTVLSASVVAIPADKAATPPEQILDEVTTSFLDAVKTSRDNWTESPHEMGTVNGTPAMRFHWSGVDKRSKNQQYGVTYAILSDSTIAIITGVGGDGPDSQTLKVLETAAQTLRPAQGAGPG